MLSPSERKTIKNEKECKNVNYTYLSKLYNLQGILYSICSFKFHHVNYVAQNITYYYLLPHDIWNMMYEIYHEGAYSTWQTKGCPTENMLLPDMLVHFRQLLRLLPSSSCLSSCPWPQWGWARWMGKGGGGESGVSSFIKALLLLEKLLLPTLPWLFDLIYSVPDGFSDHFGITLMEKSWLYLRERESY